jgi:hypothetical protein
MLKHIVRYLIHRSIKYRAIDIKNDSFKNYFLCFEIFLVHDRNGSWPKFINYYFIF